MVEHVQGASEQLPYLKSSESLIFKILCQFGLVDKNCWKIDNCILLKTLAINEYIITCGEFRFERLNILCCV